MREVIPTNEDLLRDIRNAADPRKREELRNLLVQQNMGLVRMMVNRIAGRHHDRDNLIGAGLLGLAMAIDKFEPALGHKFTTFAGHRIRSRILDEMGSDRGRVPWNENLERRAGTQPSRRTLAREAMEDIRDAMENKAARLTPKERLALADRFFQPGKVMRMRQIGDLRGFTKANASRLVNSALKKLRLYLA